MYFLFCLSVSVETTAIHNERYLPSTTPIAALARHALPHESCAQGIIYRAHKVEYHDTHSGGDSDERNFADDASAGAWDCDEDGGDRVVQTSRWRRRIVRMQAGLKRQ